MNTVLQNPDVEKATCVAARLAPMLARLGIRRVCLHGSRSKGTARPESDWDLQLELTRPLSRGETSVLRYSLQRLLRGKINLAVPGFSDPDFIAKIQPYCLEIFRK